MIDGRPLTAVPLEEIRLTRFQEELKKDIVSMPTGDE
jgi:hypothetical protein